ncbi:MAG: class I SAM-dependent methyltransferase [Acidimicrobiales bacterium]
MLSPAGYTDEEWLELLIDGLENGREGVPTGPSPAVQAQFVGWSGGEAMRECFAFFQLTKRLYDGDLTADRVLDFGVGWGRLIRLFAHDVAESNLFGVDVDPEILAVCASTGVPGTLVHSEPGAALPFAPGTFGLAYAYSVFSHLSADAARSAFAELGRVTRPGGQLTFTTQGARFLDLCAAIRDKRLHRTDGPRSDAEAMIDSFLGDPLAAREQFAAGEHVYSGTGGSGVLTGDFYGWAAIPPEWLEGNARDFVTEDVTDDPSVNEQVVITMRRR